MSARALPLLPLIAAAVLLPAATASAAGTCRALSKPRGEVITVAPRQAARLPEIVGGAPAGSTIRLRAGRYVLPPGRPLVFGRARVTLRSASGRASRVVLDGRYAAAELIQVAASRVTIAELTLTRARDHLIHAFPPEGGPSVRRLRLHRLRLIDSGEQFVKVNEDAARTSRVDRGTVSCSRFAMTRAGRARIERAFGCYTGGIDAHNAQRWRVRDNRFRGIYCEDGEVAEHAVHFWRGSGGTVVENNLVSNCSRAIGFGLNAPGDGHRGGVIRNNAVLGDVPQYDTGIELDRAAGARVLHNTLVETGRARNAFSSIDYRWPETSALIANNLVRRITARDGGRARLRANVQGFPPSWLAAPLRGDFHLRRRARGAVNRATRLRGAGRDIDGSRRGRRPDVGADELGRRRG